MQPSRAPTEPPHLEDQWQRGADGSGQGDQHRLSLATTCSVALIPRPRVVAGPPRHDPAVPTVRLMPWDAGLGPPRPRQPRWACPWSAAHREANNRRPFAASLECSSTLTAHAAAPESLMPGGATAIQSWSLCAVYPALLRELSSWLVVSSHARHRLRRNVPLCRPQPRSTWVSWPLRPMSPPHLPIAPGRELCQHPQGCPDT